MNLARQAVCHWTCRHTAGALRPLSGGPGERIKTPLEQQRAKQPQHSQIVTGGSLYRFINPELYLDTKKSGTWLLVASVWVIFGGRWLYLTWEERKYDEESEVLSLERRQKVDPLTQAGALSSCITCWQG